MRVILGIKEAEMAMVTLLQREGQHQAGDTLKGVDETLHHKVESSAYVGRGYAHRSPYDSPNHHREETHVQRSLRTENDAAELVTSKGIRTEEILGTWASKSIDQGLAQRVMGSDERSEEGRQDHEEDTQPSNGPQRLLPNEDPHVPRETLPGPQASAGLYYLS